ncbi:hypothetical protein SNEBB_002843, partial [Seison nebaliae]
MKTSDYSNLLEDTMVTDKLVYLGVKNNL